MAISLSSRVTRVLMLGLSLLAAPAARASGVKVLDPKLSSVQPTNPELDADTSVQRLVVKFHEGTRVRLRGGMMRALAAERGADEYAHMTRRGLTEEQLREDLSTVRSVMEQVPRMRERGRPARRPHALRARSYPEHPVRGDRRRSSPQLGVALRSGARAHAARPRGRSGDPNGVR